MFDINICSPIWDVVPDRSINVRVMRILMSVELLLLYLIYNIIAFVLAKVIRFDQKESADNPNVGSL